MERVQTKGGEKKKIQETNKSAIFQPALYEVHRRSKRKLGVRWTVYMYVGFVGDTVVQVLL